MPNKYAICTQYFSQIRLLCQNFFASLKKQMFYYCVLVHVFVSKCTFVDKMYNRDVFLIYHDEKCHFAEEG